MVDSFFFANPHEFRVESLRGEHHDQRLRKLELIAAYSSVKEIVQLFYFLHRLKPGLERHVVIEQQ
jgi:hypothetical protein